MNKNGQAPRISPPLGCSKTDGVVLGRIDKAYTRPAMTARNTVLWPSRPSASGKGVGLVIPKPA